MSYIIDRRLNPNGKNLGNRQKFIRRAHAQIKKAVQDSLGSKGIRDVNGGEKVKIPVKDLQEPNFGHAQGTGKRTYVHSGNKEYAEGDKMPKPQGGGGGKGNQGSRDGDGEDEFGFTLTREEFLDFFFEDMELPDLVKTSLKMVTTTKYQRSGYTNVGNPANLDIKQTMRNALGRRIALKRPNKKEIAELEAEIEKLCKSNDYEDACEVERLRLVLEKLKRKTKGIPWVDPLDVRYRQFVPKDVPNVQAVMFCIMDVSGSMGEREKDLAKRFFMLLYLFLERKYEKVDLVFIRHTHQASEVDEQTFFYDKSTGGTVVSSALELMRDIIAERYPSNEWNIYAAQASDGDNVTGDSTYCVKLLEDDIMPQLQYMAYVEIDHPSGMFNYYNRGHSPGGELWSSYDNFASKHSNFALKRIRERSDIYPVFRELFAKDKD